jgi:hypothetical protein
LLHLLALLERQALREHKVPPVLRELQVLKVLLAQQALKAQAVPTAPMARTAPMEFQPIKYGLI